MALKPRNPAAAAPAPRTRAAPAAEEASITPKAQEAAPAALVAEVTDEIITPRMAQTRQRQAPATGAATPARAVGDDVDDWTHSGEEAAAVAAAEQARREAARDERRARGYWPRVFNLIPPGTVGRNGPINDQWQKDLIIIDAKPGPSLWLHLMRNPRNGRLDVYEPCPKEFDSCPLDPPNGQYDSRYTMLLTALNINGYTVRTGERAGEFVPVTQELLMLEPAEQAFFYNQLRERGTLRGLHVTMVCRNKNEPRSGIPTEPRWHSEAAIEKLLRDNGMYKVKKTRPSAEHPDGEVIDPREDWLMQPIVYRDFLHKPSGADLRARYGSTGQPMGAREQNSSEWGNSRYEPGAAAGPGGNAGGWEGGDPADISDEVPF